MIKTVGDLKKALADYPDDMPIAGYSRQGECDFYIGKVSVGTRDEEGIDDYYCAGDSYFSDYSYKYDSANALPLGAKILVISGGSR